MTTNSDTFIISQILIIVTAALCISLAFNWFMKIKLKNLEKKSDLNIAQQGKSNEDAAPAQTSTNTKQANSLDTLSNEQLGLSSKIKDIVSQDSIHSPNKEEVENLRDHIMALEISLSKSRKQITSLDIHKKQAESELERETYISDALKKATESYKLREATLLEQTKALNLEINAKNQEIKKITTNFTLAKQELESFKEDNADTFNLKQQLEETQQLLKRSEAERALLEDKYVELEENSQQSQHIKSALERLQKEYDMLEQRYIDE